MQAWCVVLWYTGHDSNVKWVSNFPDKCPSESHVAANGHSSAFVVLVRDLSFCNNLPLVEPLVPCPVDLTDVDIVESRDLTLRFTGDLLVLLFISTPVIDYNLIYNTFNHSSSRVNYYI